MRVGILIRTWEFEVKAESLIRIAVVAGFIVLIELLCRSGIIPSSVLIPPSAMFTHGIDLLRSGKFDHDILTSLVNIVAASIVSVLLGFVLARHTRTAIGAPLDRTAVIELLRNSHLHLLSGLYRHPRHRFAADHRDCRDALGRDHDHRDAERARPNTVHLITTLGAIR
jgi:hypothetical protein